MDENVEYEEREDEFDIVRGTFVLRWRISVLTTRCAMQEDEAEIARRKMLEEEEDVDIEGGVEEVVSPADKLRQNGENDEDALWAMEEPDDDTKTWKMKVLTEDEDTM